ncbi:MAG: tRNA lysidine(34) synthetase TilS, partial [Candidatus Tectimicrobiota bacterium]
VAVSGGPDSTALLALLHDVAKEWNLILTAAHLDHGINREMGEVAWAQTRDLAERFGIRWVGKREAVLRHQQREGGSLHQVARALRYRFFTSVAAEVGATVVATGHTADDQAETVLMRLLRGAGPLGVSGIPPKRAVAGATLIRPLLAHRKGTLKTLCLERGLPFVEDPANVELSFLRSRVRHEVIPLLEKVVGHDVVPHIAAYAERLREEQEALDREADAALSDPRVERTSEAIGFPPALLQSKPPSLQKRCVVRALDALRGRAPRLKAVHLDAVVEAVARGEAGRRITFPDGWEVVVGPHAVRIGRPTGHDPWVGSVSLQAPGSTDVPALGIRVHIERRRGHTGALPAERGTEAVWAEEAVRGTVTLRTRRPGDTIIPLGGPGRRKLKKVLIDRKVPRAERDRVPVITTGQGADEEILWVVGVVVSEACRLAPDASEVWYVKVEQTGECATLAGGGHS